MSNVPYMNVDTNFNHAAFPNLGKVLKQESTNVNWPSHFEASLPTPI